MCLLDLYPLMPVSETEWQNADSIDTTALSKIRDMLEEVYPKAQGSREISEEFMAENMTSDDMELAALKVSILLDILEDNDEIERKFKQGGSEVYYRFVK